MEDVIGTLAFKARHSVTALVDHPPFRLTPTAQPGESGRFHVANSGSTLAAVDAMGDAPQAAARTIARAMKGTDEAMDRVCTILLG